MNRGYVRKIRGNPVEKQRAALDEMNIECVYEGQTPEDAIASLREGDQLAIAGSLRILADDRKALHLAMSLVKDQGATVVDVISGRTAGDAGAIMAVEAIQEMASERASHLDQSAAARKRWNKTINPTPRKVALVAWRDVVKYRKPEDALASKDMEGWTRSWAYKQLGRRLPPYGPVPVDDE